MRELTMNIIRECYHGESCGGAQLYPPEDERPSGENCNWGVLTVNPIMKNLAVTLSMCSKSASQLIDGVEVSTGN
jgi:hypothetical protein